MPDADVRHPKQGEAEQIRVGEERRRCHLRQNIHGRAQVRFGHQRQLEERLDRTVSDLLPHAVIFLPHFLVLRVRRPFDADMLQVFEAHLYGAIRPIQRRVESHAQAGDGCKVDEVRGPA